MSCIYLILSNSMPNAYNNNYIISNLEFFHTFATHSGGLAQLARAFDWQSKGHRFDSDILHPHPPKLY